MLKLASIHRPHPKKYRINTETGGLLRNIPPRSFMLTKKDKFFTARYKAQQQQ